MEDVWSWMANIPETSDWPDDVSTLSLRLVSDGDRSVVLQADCSSGLDAEASVVFSLALHGFGHHSNPIRTIWASEPLLPWTSSSSSSPVLHLVLQLVREAVILSPSRSPWDDEASFASIKLDRGPVVEAFQSETDDTRHLFELLLVLRLFFLCAFEAPAEAGFLFFRFLGTDIKRALDGGQAALGALLRAMGPDLEERIMRSLGYMIAKWCLLKGLQDGLDGDASGRPPWLRPIGCFSHAADVHGLWILKGYAPTLAMALLRSKSPGPEGGSDNVVEESALRYALGHQQLEAVFQLEHTVSLRDPRFIQIGIRIANMRLNVARLGYRNCKPPMDDGVVSDLDEVDDICLVDGERYFPTRVQVCVGPEFGSAYATGPTLGQSTVNPEREIETVRTVQGAFGAAKSSGISPRIKAKARSSTRTRCRSWRWEQEAEGSAAIFDGIMCDPVSGVEIAAWRPQHLTRHGSGGDPRGNLRKRCSGPIRALSKSGGLVVTGDELPEEVVWRTGHEMAGRRVKWRVEGRVWVSYFADEMKSGYFETRCVRWREEVELLLAGNTLLTPENSSV